MTPAKGTPSPRKGQKYPAEVLTSEEVRALLAQCSRRAPTGIRNRELITLLYRSGLRISEALALRPSDVDMDKHSIRLLDTKSGEPQTRGFHPSADDALLRWISTRRELGINGHHPLFCTVGGVRYKAGDPMSDRYVRDMLHRIAGKAGISKRVSPHVFRHTFSAELEAAGLTVSEISRLLGHGGAATTEKYLRSLTNHQAVSALAEVRLPDVSDKGSYDNPLTPTDVAEMLLSDPEVAQMLSDLAAERNRKRRQ